MKFRYIIGVLIVMISCSCIKINSSSKVQTQKKPSQHHGLNSGIRVENGPIQGLSYTNSMGIEYGHAYSLNRIYNDRTSSIHLQIDLSEEFTFPAPHNNKKFKVVTWPQELASNKETNTDGLSSELLNFFENESDTNDKVNISIAPNDKVVLTTGTLFDKSTNYYVSPNELYLDNGENALGDCENLINQKKSTIDSITLVLRLTMPMPINSCSVISCGHISYSKH
ncbi:hypothetical protein N9B82_06105 [Saprospiraceae bacterium]|nr:hypothetical protein [Saprospiraceae bacterium]